MTVGKQHVYTMSTFTLFQGSHYPPPHGLKENLRIPITYSHHENNVLPTSYMCVYVGGRGVGSERRLHTRKSTHTVVSCFIPSGTWAQVSPETTVNSPSS